MSNGTSTQDRLLDLAGIEPEDLEDLISDMEMENASPWEIGKLIAEFKSQKGEDTEEVETVDTEPAATEEVDVVDPSKVTEDVEKSEIATDPKTIKHIDEDIFDSKEYFKEMGLFEKLVKTAGIGTGYEDYLVNELSKHYPDFKFEGAIVGQEGIKITPVKQGAESKRFIVGESEGGVNLIWDDLTFSNIAEFIENNLPGEEDSIQKEVFNKSNITPNKYPEIYTTRPEYEERYSFADKTTRAVKTFDGEKRQLTADEVNNILSTTEAEYAKVFKQISAEEFQGLQGVLENEDGWFSDNIKQIHEIVENNLYNQGKIDTRLSKDDFHALIGKTKGYSGLFGNVLQTHASEEERRLLQTGMENSDDVSPEFSEKTNNDFYNDKTEQEQDLVNVNKKIIFNQDAIKKLLAEDPEGNRVKIQDLEKEIEVYRGEWEIAKNKISEDIEEMYVGERTAYTREQIEKFKKEALGDQDKNTSTPGENSAIQEALNRIKTDNPTATDREAMQMLYDGYMYNLQTLELDGSNQTVSFDFSNVTSEGLDIAVNLRLYDKLVSKGLVEPLVLSKEAKDEWDRVSKNQTRLAVLPEIVNEEYQKQIVKNIVDVPIATVMELGYDGRDFEGWTSYGTNRYLSDEHIDDLLFYESANNRTLGEMEAMYDMINMNVDPSTLEKGGFGGELLRSGVSSVLTHFTDVSAFEADKIVARGGGHTNKFIQDATLEVQQSYNTAVEHELYKDDVTGKTLEVQPLQWTDEQQEAFKSTFAEEVGAGVGHFVPMLIELGVYSAVSGMVLSMPRIALALNKLRNAGAWGKMMNHSFMAMVEESKMYAADFDAGTGAAFYAGGALTRGLTPFKNKFKGFDPIWQKVIKAGPVGATSSQLATVASMAIDDLQGDVDFMSAYNEHFADKDKSFRDWIVESMVFAVVGATHIKAVRIDPITGKLSRGSDITGVRYKERAVSAFKKEQEKLLKEGENKHETEKQKQSREQRQVEIDQALKEMETDLGVIEKQDGLKDITAEQIKLEKENASIIRNRRNNSRPENWDLFTRKEKIEYLKETNSKLNNNKKTIKKLDTAKKEYLKTLKEKGMIKDSRYYLLSEKSKDAWHTLEQAKKSMEAAIRVEDASLKLDPRSKNFEKNAQKMVHDPAIAAIKTVVPEFKKYKVVYTTNPRDFVNKDAVAEFNAKTNVMLFNKAKYTPGKAIHEIIHAALRAKFKQNPNFQVRFNNSFAKIFGKHFDIKEVKEMFEGTDMGTWLEKNYKKSQRNEEYLAYMVELLTDPKIYRKVVATSFFKEAKQEFKSTIEETFGLKFNPKTPKEFIDMLGRLSQDARRGLGFSTKAAALAELDKYDFLGIEYYEQAKKQKEKKDFKETFASKDIKKQERIDVETKKKQEKIEEIKQQNKELVANKPEDVKKQTAWREKTKVNNEQIQKLNKEILELEAQVEGISLKNLERNKTNKEWIVKYKEAKKTGDRYTESKAVEILKENNQGYLSDFIEASNIKRVSGSPVTKESYRKQVENFELLKIMNTWSPGKAEFGAYLRQTLMGPNWRPGMIPQRKGNILQREMGGAKAQKEIIEGRPISMNRLMENGFDVADNIYNPKAQTASTGKGGNMITREVDFVNEHPVTQKHINTVEKNLKDKKKIDLEREDIDYNTLPELAPGFVKKMVGNNTQQRANYLANYWESTYRGAFPEGNVIPKTGKTNGIETSLLGLHYENKLDLEGKQERVFVGEGKENATYKQTGNPAGNPVKQKIQLPRNKDGTYTKEAKDMFLEKYGIKDNRTKEEIETKTGDVDISGMNRNNKETHLPKTWGQLSKSINIQIADKALKSDKTKLNYIYKNTVEAKLDQLASGASKDLAFASKELAKDLLKDIEKIPNFRGTVLEFADMLDGKKYKKYTQVEKERFLNAIEKVNEVLVLDTWGVMEKLSVQEKLIVDASRVSSEMKALEAKNYNDLVNRLKELYPKNKSVQKLDSKMPLERWSEDAKAKEESNVFDLAVANIYPTAILGTSKTSFMSTNYQGKVKRFSHASGKMERMNQPEQNKTPEGYFEYHMKGKWKGTEVEKLPKDLKKQWKKIDLDAVKIISDMGKEKTDIARFNEANKNKDNIVELLHEKGREMFSAKDKTFEQTVSANKALREFHLSAIREVFLNHKKYGISERAALESLLRHLRAQTNISNGFIKGTATVTSISKMLGKPVGKDAKAKNYLGTMYHAEHQLQLLNHTLSFVDILLRTKGNKAAFRKELSMLSELFEQSITVKQDQLIYDSPLFGGNTTYLKAFKGRNLGEVASILNIMYRPGVAAEMVNLKSKKPQTWVETILDNYSQKQIETLLKEASIRGDWNGLGHELNMRNKDSYRKTEKQIDKLVEASEVFASKDLSRKNKTKALRDLDKAISNAEKKEIEKRGMSTFDFDETLIVKGKNFITVTNPTSGKKIKISSEKFPIEGPKYQKLGWKFDFKDFVNVRGGVEGPLFQKLKNQISKYGSENVYILTARPKESATAIHGWLKSKGVDLSLKNITGLANSSGKAKAKWMLEKFAEGYNDMYFVDDALSNVKAVKKVLDKLDIKSKVQQVKLEKHGKYLIDTSTKGGQKLINEIKNIPTISSSEFKKAGKWLINTKTKEGQKIVDEINSIKTISSSEFKKVGPWIIDLTTPEGKKIQQELKNIKTVSSNVLASKNINQKFNKILEETTGVSAEKIFSKAKATLMGREKWTKSLMTAGNQDFMGLMQNFAGRGKKGEAQLKFFKDNLQTPFAKAYNNMNIAKQAIANDYKGLSKQLPKVKKKLNKKIPGSVWTYDQAIRVHRWTEAGFKIPDISKRDIKELTDVVKNDAELLTFSNKLGELSKQKDGYIKPTENWLVESVVSDLHNITMFKGREQYLAEFVENRKQIFGEWKNGKLEGPNMNKIEATQGKNFKEALEDMMWRMETGTNRPTGKNALVNAHMDFLNGAVGATMFFNTRSATLQLLSTFNFINWKDNNPLKAGIAFANQPRYWKDFAYIFNSDMLKQRRSGLKYNVSEAEIAQAAAQQGHSPKKMLAWFLKKGFLPTQMADSFAISAGGASFYRNRINTYKKQGLSEAEAKKKAWLDFQETAEVSQQSSRPDLISRNQAGPMGRTVLAWANTPMQYGRIKEKAIRDIINRRGDTKTHLSKLAYYGAIQSALFAGLQAALFAFALDEEDDMVEYDKYKKKDGEYKTNPETGNPYTEKEIYDLSRNPRVWRVANTMLDGELSGFGIPGKVVSTAKNTVMEFQKQEGKSYGTDHAYTMLQMFSYSPVLGSKARKFYSATQTWKYNDDEIKEMGLTLDNPGFLAGANVIEGITNIPAARVLMKVDNLRNAANAENQWWQRVASFGGWSRWNLGIGNEALEEAKIRVKIANKNAKNLEKYKGIPSPITGEDYTVEEIEITTELFDLNKEAQVDMLMNLGLSSRQIKALKYEQDRVNKIMQLQSKKKQKLKN